MSLNFSKLKFGALAVAAFVLLILLAMRSTQLFAQQAELTPLRGPIPQAYFGLHVHHVWSDPVNHQWNEAEFPTVPFGTWRLWDAHVLWTYLEPTKGNYNFTILDRYVEDTQRRHIQTVLTLEGTPTWASARPAEVPSHADGSKGMAGSAAEPASLQDWQDFVRTVATRYKGKILFYEIWNEPMFKPYFSGSPQSMVSIVSSAASVLKEIDPSIRILQPPVGSDPASMSFLKSFLQAGGGKYIDIYSLHLYPGGVRPPEINIARTTQIRQLLRSFGEDSKPMWITEEGFEFNKMEPQMGANYVARALLLGWPLGYSRLFIYSWDHESFGLAPAGHDNTPMVKAYATVEQWLNGATMTRCIMEPNGLWIENLTLADGTQGKVMWASNGPVRVGRDHTGEATSYSAIDGQKYSLKPDGTIELGGAPILLTSSGKAHQ